MKTLPTVPKLTRPVTPSFKLTYDGFPCGGAAQASELSVDAIKMLGRLPCRLLNPHATSEGYGLVQVSWPRKLVELPNARRLAWLEIRDRDEKRQKSRW